jgi:hemerythrin superfamily protein
MDATVLLKRQHKEVSALFDDFEAATGDKQKQRIFERIADELAIHTTIEETHFYPACRSRGTKEDLAEAYDEHKEVKKLLRHALASTDAPGFDGIVAAIRGAVEHHVDEEENQLFPKVKKLLDKAELDDIGDKMQAQADELKQRGNARAKIKPTPAPA